MNKFSQYVATLALAFSLAVSLTAPGAASAQTQGTPWTGDPGFQTTTEKLQAEQKAEDARTAGVGRPARILPFRKADRSGNKNNPGSPDTPLQGKASSAGIGLLAAQTLSTINFTGATLADTGAFPPDSMGAVGPTQFIVAVNGRIRSFVKTTGIADGVLNLDTDVFFASVMTPPLASNFTTDPRIRYDRQTARWFITMIDVPGGAGALPNRVMIAVSDTSTITGATVWTFFQFQQDLVTPAGDTGFLADYPTLGIDANALYIGANMFNSTGNFQNSTAFVVRKTSVLGAGPIVVTAFRNLITLSGAFPGPFTPQGVDNFDSAATVGYFIGVDFGSFGLLQMRRVTSPGGTPTLSANVPITVANTSFPANVPHLGNTGGTNGLLDGLDDRLYAAQVRNGELWTAHSIGTNGAGTATSNPSVLRNALRWYQLGSLTGTPAVIQSGTVNDAIGNGGNANWYWIPSIAVNGQGHAAMGFSAAGITRADAAFTGRLATDALGTMPGPLTRITNTTFDYNPALTPGNSNPRRWGDFSFTSVDPIDDMSIWTVQEFTNATNSYGVRVAKLSAPPPATPNTPSPSSIAAGQASVNVTLTGTSTNGSGFFEPGANLPAPALPFNHIAASVTGGVTVNSITYLSPTLVTLNVSTVGATQGTQSITITNPDGQTATGTNILTITGIAQTITFGPLANKTFGDPPFTVSATGGGSGNPVTFTAAPPSVCTVSGNLVTITGVGSCTITANQAGDALYAPAPSVPQSFNVLQATQTITFGPLADKTFGDPPFGVSATGGGSGNPVTFSSLTTGVCTVSGSTVTIVAAGLCTVAADQAGNTNYSASPQVTQSFNVAQAAQVITFGPLADKVYTDPPFTVGATGGASGNPVTFSSLTTGVCTVSGNTVTIVTIGLCTIAADQAGNANYLAAPQVTQSFSVTAGPASTITATGGTPQAAAINTNYATPLSVLVSDAGSNPVSGASVTFTLPASGASGTFPGAVTTAIVATNASGAATSPTVTANGTVGAFLATATVTGVATPASFSLLNTGGAAYTIVVTPATPDWLFVTESGTGAGAFVPGPGTPPAGTGSVELQAVTTDGGELFYTQQFAGMRLDTVKGLQFSTFINAGAFDAALDFDVDADLNSPTAVYEGRLVFVPGLIPGAVVPGVWQTWDAYTQKAWYATGSPINATCTQATPCTLTDILTAYPNAGVIAQLFPGAFGFKLGNNGATGTVSVDKLVLVREGPPATFTAWTYDFEPVSPAPATVTATAGTPQSTPINTAFAAPLSAEVRDAATQLLSGVSVTFDLPASGASGTFPGSVISANVLTTSVAGQATSPVVTANAIGGSYTASATAGAATPASFALTNTQVGTTTSLGSAPNPSSFGQLVTLTATVAPAVATGSVTFFDGVTNLGSNALVAGTATLGTSTLAPGPHVLTAVYGGDASYSGSTSAPVTQVVNQIPASITATGGTPQSTAVNTAFATALEATVKDSGGFGVPSIVVTFTLPGSGASGTFPGAVLTANATTDASGIATSPIVTANAIAGSYNATATAPGVATPADFALTNTAGAAASITATGGTPQSTLVSTAFAAVLQATVVDAGSNPVPGASVTFTLPASGASATFPGAVLTAIAITDASGIAVSPIVTANATAGSYNATATVPGAVTPATFSLQNTANAPVLQSAASRKVHGAAGTFNIPLLLLPTTNPTTEPRQGPTATIVFTFDKPITGATATITEGAAATGALTFSGNEVIVPLTGVANAQYVTISLSNVASADGGTGGSGSVRVGFLRGDVNQNRVVSVADVGLVNAQLAQLVTAANFIYDINATGTLTVADKGIANAAQATALPPP